MTDIDDKQYLWPAVLERYRDAYGGEPDFEDRTDRYLVLTLMEEAVHDRISRKMVTMLREATARIKAIGEPQP